MNNVSFRFSESICGIIFVVVYVLNSPQGNNSSASVIGNALVPRVFQFTKEEIQLSRGNERLTSLIDY